MKTVYVFAKTAEDFWHCVKQRDHRTYSFFWANNVAVLDGVHYWYCKNADALRGKHNVQVEFWGNVLQRKDYGDLVRAARYARLP